MWDWLSNAGSAIKSGWDKLVGNSSSDGKPKATDNSSPSNTEPAKSLPEQDTTGNWLSKAWDSLRSGWEKLFGPGDNGTTSVQKPDSVKKPEAVDPPPAYAEKDPHPVQLPKAPDPVQAPKAPPPVGTSPTNNQPAPAGYDNSIPDYTFSGDSLQNLNQIFGVLDPAPSGGSSNSITSSSSKNFFLIPGHQPTNIAAQGGGPGPGPGIIHAPSGFLTQTRPTESPTSTIISPAIASATQSAEASKPKPMQTFGAVCLVVVVVLVVGGILASCCARRRPRPKLKKAVTTSVTATPLAVELRELGSPVDVPRVPMPPPAPACSVQPAQTSGQESVKDLPPYEYLDPMPAPIYPEERPPGYDQSSGGGTSAGECRR
ncbi:hypothetical protein FN846DRAFT_892519 [Sphaerosporella brunnea]|uniref:Uncharacterized protein n=1 Tax=Sphaerosporella brunnea TaxID=1250544 RepID=A0A5J5ENU8_9PEZI|nr:hypothetical protein FN846DRAFT_892519 [Sphaerosporella brunnea]